MYFSVTFSHLKGRSVWPGLKATPVLGGIRLCKADGMALCVAGCFPAFRTAPGQNLFKALMEPTRPADGEEQAPWRLLVRELRTMTCWRSGKRRRTTPDGLIGRHYSPLNFGVWKKVLWNRSGDPFGAGFYVNSRPGDVTLIRGSVLSLPGRLNICGR